MIDASPGDRDLGPQLRALRDAVHGAAVYRAFNTLAWSDYVDPDYGGTVPDLFYAGPDDDTATRSKGWSARSGCGPCTSAATTRSNWWTRSPPCGRPSPGTGRATTSP